ncbi:MAG: rod shape-determining protein MreC [Candidatus Moranbacteria bacterium]|nr:rod shape-determining protein MreC [Candidatus Moranbacteria bacterium]NTW45687.1 rod shape-determining protein MreC [Candidatus Moranbacteria bacterium]
MRPNGVSQSKLFRAVVVLALLAALAFWNPSPLGSLFRGVFHTLALPFEKVFSSGAYAFRDFRESVSSIGNLKGENERLTEENLRLKAENASLSFLRDENDAIRKASGLEIRTRFDLEAAEVVAGGGEGGRGSVIIDKGSLQGVRDGMPAVVGEGVLVGIVTETYPGSARVTLVTGSDSALGGVVVGNGAQGVVRGDRNLGIVLGNVPQASPLSQGDRVVTSGVGVRLPAGLLVGTVDSVRDAGDRLFKEGTIVSPADFSSLRFLFLVRSEKDS